MNMMKSVVILAILLAPYTFMHANAQEETKVDIADGASKADNGKFFEPVNITINVGTTVVWRNFDDAPHTITSGTPTCVGECWGLDFDSGIVRLDDVYQFTFNKVGTYNYLCSLHPWMIGKVTVVPEGSSLTTVSVATDKNAYKPGDNVNVEGNVNPVVADQPVRIEVLNPSHAQFQSDTITVKDDGTFKYDFKLTGDLALPGSYTVKVTYSDTNTESTFVLEKPGKPDQNPPFTGGPGSSIADLRVVARQIKDLVIIRVTSADDSGASVYGISIQVPDSDIKAFKGPSDWSKPETLSSEIRSSTQDHPIEPGEKAYFKLKVGAGEIVIHWTAYDESDGIVDQGDTKPISRGK